MTSLTVVLTGRIGRGHRCVIERVPKSSFAHRAYYRSIGEAIWWGMVWAYHGGVVIDQVSVGSDVIDRRDVEHILEEHLVGVTGGVVGSEMALLNYFLGELTVGVDVSGVDVEGARRSRP